MNQRYLNSKEALSLSLASGLARHDGYPLNTRIDINVSQHDIFMNCSTISEIQNALDEVQIMYRNMIRDFYNQHKIPNYSVWVKENPSWQLPIQRKNRDYIDMRNGDYIDSVQTKPNIHFHIHVPVNLQKKFKEKQKKFTSKHTQLRLNYLSKVTGRSLNSFKPVLTWNQHQLKTQIQATTYLMKGVKDNEIIKSNDSWEFYPHLDNTKFPSNRFTKSVVDVSGFRVGKLGSQGIVHGNRVGFSQKLNPTQRLDQLVEFSLAPSWIGRYNLRNENHRSSTGLWFGDYYKSIEKFMTTGDFDRAKNLSIVVRNRLNTLGVVYPV